MDFAALTSMTGEEVTAALALDFNSLDAAALTAALTERKAEITRMFGLTEPTVKEVDIVEALVASVKDIETEQATRAAAVKDAEKRFAAARTAFSNDDTVEVEEPNADASEDEENEDTEESTDSEDSTDEEAPAESEGETAEEATVTASVNHTTSQKISAARAVAAKVKRPARQSAPVTITASADVPGFATGSEISDMEQVTKALINRANGFGKFNIRAAQALQSQGITESLHKFGVASFSTGYDPAVTQSKGNDYAAVRNAIKMSNDTLVASMAPDADPTLTAAGWCAPSTNIYSYIADYVVDGLSETPEVSVTRGGINITTGPAKSSQGTALDDFGWTQTEAQAEAGQEKPCETIVCPDFVDHRLDAVGYCYKIPILTQKAYPELITDALKFASVLYAHRMNRRVISDKVALSNAVTWSGYGASFTDSLEALSLLATAERRRWNLGRNAIMTVEVPEWALEVYRADMSRRNGIAKDSVSDGDIARHFADRRLNVSYVADWQEISIESGHLVLPGDFEVMIYPAGTFIKAVEDVINLSAVYDAATLAVNEYTGVFFEQGYLLAKAGYGSSLVTVPVNTAGEQGALVMTGLGDSHANGSF